MSNVAIVSSNPGERSVPWYGATTKRVEGLQSLEQIKQIYPEVFYPVELRPVFIGETETRLGSAGQMVSVEVPTNQTMPNRFVTTRVHPNGRLVPYNVFTKRYSIVQEEEVLGRALNIIAASNQEAVFDSIASFRDGGEVLFVIDMGSLIIDPAGVGDTIDRFLIVQNSHDGSTPVTFMNTSIRIWCKNMLPSAEEKARAVFKSRHTPNQETRMQEAEKVLRINAEWAREFKEMATRMLATPVTSGQFDQVINRLWPESAADTDRKKANRDEIVEAVKLTYKNNRNAGAVGDNGWAAFNAVVEFLDHGRSVSVQHRRNLLNYTSNINAQKRLARDAVLALS